MISSTGLIDNNFKLIFSNLNLAQLIIKMLFKEILNVSINEEDVVSSNTVIEGIGGERIKEHIMDLRFDINDEYAIDIEMQNYLNGNRKKLLKRFLHYLAELFILYVNQRKNTERTEYVGIILAKCKINNKDFVELHEMANLKDKDVINCFKLYTIDFTKIDKCDNIVLREFVEVLTSDASYEYKGDNKLMENLLYEIYGTTLTAQQIEANIRRRRNIEFEQDLIEYSQEQGLKKGIRQGKKEGIKLGKKEHQKEIIKKSLAKGKTLEEIADFLDLTVDKVKKCLKTK